MNIPVTLGLGALLVVLGRFLDRYYVDETRRQPIREALSRFYGRVESWRVSNGTQRLIAFVVRRVSVGRYMRWLFSAILAYLWLGVIDYMIRCAFRLPRRTDFLTHAASWAGDPTLLLRGVQVTTGFVLTLALTRQIRSKPHKSASDEPQPYDVLVAGINQILSTAGYFYLSRNDSPPHTLAEIVAAVLPGLLITMTVALMTLACAVMRVTRWVSLQVIRPARDPRHSPFTYACDLAAVMLGVAALVRAVAR